MNILLKLLGNGIVAVPGLIWSGTGFGFAAITSVLVSLISYLVGDRLLLPKTNNMFASLADLLLSFLLFWAITFLFYEWFSLNGIFLTAFAVAIVEYFYHAYLQRQGTHHSKHPG
ncbi:DUF2512 family protein [Brevibacillus fulvus]|uniref:DUF2512 family protein n=1 Tax=Brevibacillus fulvus TaxID=1125967 RepID=A0A938Y1E5_9BACL|nr:DUF2512 family protein [Brevibacillus fulvus]MBM7589390.1 hypothetical protein [Brevibacillus fulvus]